MRRQRAAPRGISSLSSPLSVERPHAAVPSQDCRGLEGREDEMRGRHEHLTHVVEERLSRSRTMVTW